MSPDTFFSNTPRVRRNLLGGIERVLLLMFESDMWIRLSDGFCFKEY